MATFEWVRFLDQHAIPYAMSGPNVSKGNVAIKCPYCGVEDDSQHMSVSLRGKGWRCWRHPTQHRGRSPIKLVQALLHCPYEHAARIVGVKQHHVPEDFMSQVQQFMAPKKQVLENEKLQLPAQFKALNPVLYSCKPFMRYLEGRHFPYKVVREDLWYCSAGSFKGRLIFPVYNERGYLATWTGRTIYPSVDLRYKTLSPDEDKARSEGLPKALAPIGHYVLYEHDLLRDKRHHTICICEGPMDALKIRMLGDAAGVTATALFTAIASDKQVGLLHTILPRFSRRLIVLDANTMPTALRLQNMLSGLGAEVITVPSDLKDPGALRSRADLLSLIG